MFGHDQFSPIYRYLESRIQNNECPVESIISMFEKRTFRNQHEDTAENRAIIKIHGDSISGAEMTVSSNEAWGNSKAYATNHVRAISQRIGQGIRSRIRETRTKI